MDIECAQCGYGLVGLAEDGSCPECGHSITASRDTHRRLASALGTRLLGLTGPLCLNGLAMLLVLAMIAGMLFVSEFASCLGFLALLVHVGASCAGGSQCGPTLVERNVAPWRRAGALGARVALATFLAIPLVFIGMMCSAGLSLTSMWVVLFAWWIANGVVVAACAWTLQELAKPLGMTGRDGGARLAFFLAIPSVALGLIGLVTTQLQVTWQSGAIVGAITIGTGLFAYVVAVLALAVAAFRMRRAQRSRERT
jgi:hypothetical protein